jgi:Exostosin family
LPISRIALNNKIKIYSSKDWLEANSTYHFILYPFWGIDTKYQTDPNNIFYHRFDKFIENAPNYFDLVKNPEETDYVVCPIDYGNVGKTKNNPFQKSQDLAKSLNKPLMVFYFSDFDEPLELDNCIVFRNSLDSRTRKSYEYAAPAMVEDFRKFLNVDNNTPKTATPKIGYCGYIDYENTKDWLVLLPHRLKNWVKDTFFNRHIFEAEKVRGKAVRTLLKNKNVDLHFIKRVGYWGKWATQSKVIKDTFKEYTQTIEETDYHLVARGNGNFSIRFSEILSSGRIPVFIDTHCVMPFEDIIDWKKLLVWVDITEIDRIDEVLLNFHSNISEEEFRNRKKEMKRIFEEYISPDGFFKNMHKILNYHLKLASIK